MIKLLPLSFKASELPIFKESRRGDWYEYGSNKPYKNNYGSYLVKLLNESSKQSTIIESKTKFIVGRGFYIDKDISFSERALVEAFLRQVKETNLLVKIVKDKKVFGGFAIQVILNKQRKIVGLEHIDFNNIRVGTEDNYYYTSDWNRNPEGNEDFTEFFNFNQEANTSDNYLIYFKEYRPDLGEYPIPDYVAAIPYLEADAEIANFTLSNIRNNLSAGYVVSFNNGEPSDEEMREIERKFKDYATGTDNAGKPLLSFTDQQADHPQIIPIPVNGQDDRFINLNKQIQEEIFTAHSIVSPMLFGIKDTSGLGSNADELRTASELYQNLQVDTEQDILEDVFNELINFNGLPKCLKIQKIEPVGKPLSEATIVGAMTSDELREKIGLPMSEVKSNKTADAISILSPLVATKVLDNLSVEEIRSLIGLAGSKEVVRKFNDIEDEMIFSQLKEIGYNVKNLEVLDTRETPITCFEDAEKFEAQIKEEFLPLLTNLEKSVLSLLIGNPKMPNTEIIKALEISIEDTQKAIASLQNKGALDIDFKPTEQGKKTIQIPDEEIFVVYKYALRTDAPALKTHSRPFCQQMMFLANSGRRYSLNQLKLLRNDFNQSGIEIFQRRGGWYHNPRLDVNTPYCRHIWSQEIVRIKNI